MKKISLILIALFFPFLYSASAYTVLTPTALELNAQELLKDAVSSYDEISGYQVVFEREELSVEGKWKREANFMRFDKPFTMVMCVTEGHSRGRQILYSEGNFDDKMIVRPPGFFFAFIPLVELDIDDPRVAKGEKRSIKRAGIGPFLESFIEQFKDSRERGRLQVLEIEEVEIKGEKGTRLDIAYLDPSYSYQRETVVFSNEHNLPIEICLYKTREELVETYRYLELKPNPLGDDPDFRGAIDARLFRKFQEIK